MFVFCFQNLGKKNERTILSTILTTKKAKQLIINYLAFC